jgi:membrane protease YdiL (CAAX protease family)
MGTATAETDRPFPTAARIALLVFAMLFPSFMASLYFVYLPSGGLAQAAYFGGKVLQFAFPVLFVLLVEGHLPRPKRPHFAGLGIGLAFGLAVAAGMLALYYGWLADTLLFTDTGKLIKGKLDVFHVSSPAEYLLLSVVIVAVHSLAEEYYWRWFTFAQLNKVVNLPLAIALSSAAFVGHHVLVLYAYFPGRLWVAVVPFSLAIGVGGAFWAWLFARTQTIYSSWLSHALVDAAIFVIGWDLLQRVGWGPTP